MIRLLSLCLIVSASLLSGCTGGGKMLSADKLSALKPGQTTRAEMVQWFGQPGAVGMDTTGRASATWFHVLVIPTPFVYGVQQQMLAAVFETNDVLMKFTVSDQINRTNNPSVKTARSPKDS